MKSDASSRSRTRRRACRGSSRSRRAVGAESSSAVDALPGLDAALLHPLRDLLEQLGRARMQRAGLAVQEERHRHAPLALARQRPVRPVGDHAVQPRLAPGGEELASFSMPRSAVARSDSSGFRRRTRHFVHDGEPLRGGAEDDRRLVAPAVHVAVDVLAVHGEQRALRLERLARSSGSRPRSTGRRTAAATGAKRAVAHAPA